MALHFDGPIADRHPADPPRNYLPDQDGAGALVVCELCGASVPDAATGRHDEWHVEVGRAIFRLGQR